MTTLPASSGGWVLLGGVAREQIALGLVGKFWKPVIEYAQVAPEDFRSFLQPGYARRSTPFRYGHSINRIRPSCRLSWVPRPPTSTPDAGTWRIVLAWIAVGPHVARSLHPGP